MADYTPHSWADDAAGGTPIDAATLNEMETGIDRASIPTKVTALPGSPYDGQEVYLEVDEANGIYWHLRYRSASASAYKWEFLGGPPLTDEIAASESTTSSSFTDLATVGPEVTLPLDGDYMIEFGASLFQTTSGQGHMAIKLGAAATNEAEGLYNGNSGSGSQVYSSRTMRRDGLSASDVLKAQYKNTAGTNLAAANRYLNVWPVRVG